MKKKINTVKRFLHDNKGIIENGLFLVGCFTFGKLIGSSFVAISDARANNAYQIGVNACWDQLIVENSDNPEFLKILSDFAIKHPVYNETKN